MMNDIIQLKITLSWTKPPIWRRVLVDKRNTFFKLHNIIQIAMGWENYHLYEFDFKDYRIGIPNEEFDDFYSGRPRPKLLDAKDVTLESIIKDVKEKFIYEYDFGDSWRHDIVVEKFLPLENEITYPICLDGKLNCPPEDCGGIPGFYELIEIIGDKRHRRRKEMLEWLDGPYDPEYFDKVEVNEKLKNLDQYIMEFGDDE